MCSFKPLLNPKTPFKWTEELQAKFEKSKAILAKVIEERVCIFNQYQKTCRSPDWLWKQHCKCPLDTRECCVERWKMTLAVSYFLWSPKQCYTLVEENLVGTWKHEGLHSWIQQLINYHWPFGDIIATWRHYQHTYFPFKTTHTHVAI